MSDEISTGASAPASEAPPPPAAPIETPPDPTAAFRAAKHKLKVNGKEEELDYDKLLERASRVSGADEKFKRASEIEKRYERVKDPNAENFDELVELLGYQKATKFARQLVLDEMKWDELTEEQQDAIIARREADLSKKKLSEYEEREKSARIEAERGAALEIVDREVGDALAAARAEGVPVADLPEIVEQVVDEMIAYLEWYESEEKEGRRPSRPPPSPKDVIGKLQGRYDERSGAYLKKLPVEKLKSLLSKEQLSALRAAEINDLRSPIPRGTKTPDDKGSIDPFQEERRPRESRRMKSDDWFTQMNKKLGG